MLDVEQGFTVAQMLQADDFLPGRVELKPPTSPGCLEGSTATHQLRPDEKLSELEPQLLLLLYISFVHKTVAGKVAQTVTRTSESEPEQGRPAW